VTVDPAAFRANPLGYARIIEEAAPDTLGRHMKQGGPLEAALAEASAARLPFELKRLREETARFRSEPQRHGSAYFIRRRREGA